ncbi:MAG: PEGA domain-containing protein, partial [Thermoplasmata archaeon]|nr:PEGA domain-containing protein [Thermoplasmata archaeon]
PQELAISFSLRPSYIVGVVEPGNATVTVDGVAAPVINGAFNVSVSAGTYAVMATLSGFSTYEGNFTTTAGNVTPVLITLQPASSRQAEPSTSVVSSPWTTFAPIIILGIAIIGVAVVALILSRGRRRTLPPPPRLGDGGSPAKGARGRTDPPEASNSALGASK